MQMLHLEQGKSYRWLFAIYVVVFTGGVALCEALGNFSWGILTMPAFLTFVLLSELRSGIALDSWWRASHPKGSRQYQAVIAWHAVLLVLLLAFSYFFIHLWLVGNAP
jgi:hypothetical protein